MKCDKETPCNHCLRRGESGTCVYEQQKPEQPRASKQSAAAELAKVKARLEQVEAASNIDRDYPVKPTMTTVGRADRQSGSQSPDRSTEGAKEWEDWSMFQRLSQKDASSSHVAHSKRLGNLKDISRSTHHILSRSAIGGPCDVVILLSLLPSRSEALQLIEDK